MIEVTSARAMPVQGGEAPVAGVMRVVPGSRLASGRGRRAIAPRLALTLAVLGLAGCSLVPSPPTVTIPAGLAPRMTVDQVEARVMGLIGDMERTLGRVVTPARVVSIEAERVGPDPGQDPSAGPSIRWRIRAEGTFTTRRGPPGEMAVATSGYFVISDEDGSVIEFGFP